VIRRPRPGAEERPISCVPRAVLCALLLALGLQIGVHSFAPGEAARPAGLPPAPPAPLLQLAAMGDPLPVARTLSLYLQSFDQRALNPITFQAFDYDVLLAWLRRIVDLDPAAQYPLMLASRVYADVPDEAKQRAMLQFVHDRFLEDPGRRWPWLAHAAVIAKHRLKDLPLARQYASAVQQYAAHPHVPAWARQMEAFILEDMNELEAARLMIGGFIEKGMVKDPVELRFLEQRLQEIERRIRGDK
jgi:hypothetical protein